MFFDWYNHEHRHSGIGLMTPAAVHLERAHELHARAPSCSPSLRATPRTVVRQPPVPPELPTAAWINKPEDKEAAH